MVDTNKIDKDLWIKKLNEWQVDTNIERELNTMKFDTAELILRMKKKDFEIKGKTEEGDSIDDKIIILKWDKSYEDLRKKALVTFLENVIINGKNIDPNVLSNLKKKEIKKVIESDNGFQKKIKEEILNGNLTIKNLENLFKNLWLGKEDLVTFINILSYWWDIDSIVNLASAYNEKIQLVLNNYIKTKGKLPNSTEIIKIKNDVFKKFIDSHNWDWFTEKILVPIYWKVEIARKVFEQKATKITKIDKKWKKEWWKYWEKFKQWWVFGFIDYAVNQTSMNKSHKQMAQMLWQIWVTIWLIVWLWKMVTSDCLIKWDNGKCKLKWWFLRSILFLWGSEFAYNWATKWKHSLPELVWAFLTWWLDKSYLPWGSNETSRASNTLKSTDIDKAKYNVEMRKQITDPLLVKLLFTWETIKDIKNECYSSKKLDFNKLLNHLKTRADQNSKYTFAYLLVKWYKDNWNENILEESVESGIDINRWYIQWWISKKVSRNRRYKG